MINAAFYSDSGSSYKYVTLGLIQGLQFNRVDLRTPPMERPVHLVCGPLDWCSNNTHLIEKEHTAIFTMNESTRVRPQDLLTLEKAKVVIVPSYWGASCLAAQGLNNNNLFVCPLGSHCTPKAFANLPVNGTLNFGTVVKASSGDGLLRKGIYELLEVFSRLNGHSSAVLHILCPDWPDSVITPSNVRVIKRTLPQAEYEAWIASMHCGIFPSKGEGFGLAQLDFAMSAKAVIAPAYGPVIEFIRLTMPCVINGRLVDAQGRLETQGLWFHPDTDSILRVIKNLLLDRAPLVVAAARNMTDVAHLTWTNSANVLLSILKQTKVYQ